MSEAIAYQTLRARVPMDYQRLTDKLALGIPDTVYVWRKPENQGFLELKYMDRWVKPKLLGMRPMQAQWSWSWAKKGGRSAVLLRVGRGDLWYLFKPRPDTEWVFAMEASVHPSSPLVSGVFNLKTDVPAFLKALGLDPT